MATFITVGKPLPRVEGAAKATGETIYAADIRLPRMLHAKVLRSPYGHARIRHLDTRRAKAHPGVAAVFTAADIPNLRQDTGVRNEALLAVDEALFFGQPIAAVLAEDPSVAEEALDLIDVTYEELPAVVDLVEAIREDSPSARSHIAGIDASEEAVHTVITTPQGMELEINSGSNIAQHLVYQRGDVERGFAEADLVVERTWNTSWVHQGYIETQGAVVDYHAPSGEYTVWTGTQGQFRIREELAKLLDVPETKVRCEVVEMGGGFGGKTQPVAAGLCAVLARATQRPVKLIMSRSEDLKAAIPAPPAFIELKTGVKKDGTLTAIKARVIVDSGAYPGGPLASALQWLGGYYKCPNLELGGHIVMTNKPSVGALRAPGTPQATFAIESQMDIMARELGLDPLEFRLKNAVEQGDLMPAGRPYPRIGLRECLERLRETDFWKNRNQKGPNQGVGIAVGGWLGGLQPASAAVRLNTDGTFSVLLGSNDITGVNTSFAQIAAEELGLPMEKVYVRTGNTSSAPYSGVSGGSKTLRAVGRAVQAAARDARDQLFHIAAQKLEARPEDLEAVGGAARVKGSPERSLSYEILANFAMGFSAAYPPVVGTGNVPSSTMAPIFTVQGVKLEVDPDTGEVTILDSLCIQDVGFAINPLSVEGQIQGGVSQSLAIGFSEEMVFDKQGILRNPTLLDYRMPTALDLPNIQAILVEVPSGEEPYGARGVGEPPIVGGAPAVAIAIYDAVGARVMKLPATPERILDAMGKLN